MWRPSLVEHGPVWPFDRSHISMLLLRGRELHNPERGVRRTGRPFEIRQARIAARSKCSFRPRKFSLTLHHQNAAAYLAVLRSRLFIVLTVTWIATLL